MTFEYAPAPESRAVVDIASSYGLFINGEFTAPVDGGSFKTMNPATEEVLSEIGIAGKADVDAAVSAARRAHGQVWGPMAGRDRAKYLFRIARLPDRLAIVKGFEDGKFAGPLLDEARDAEQVLRPVTSGHRPPHLAVGSASGADRCVDVGLPSDGDLRQHLLGRGV